MEAALERTVVGGHGAERALRRWLWVGAAAAVIGAITAGVAWTVNRAGGAGRADRRAAAAAGDLTARRLTVPDKVTLFSNPSDDGRFAAGMTLDDGDVAIVDLLTGDYRPLHMGPADGSEGYASMGALTPDARYVAVDWYDERDGSLRVVATDGGPARVLVDPPGDVTAYQWSRDGSMILAALGRDDGNVLALVAESDGGVRVLCPLGPEVPLHASLSPDARYVVFDHPQQAGATDRDLYILDAHTGEQWPLEMSPGHDISPHWTPDGSAVVFISDRNRNPSLWMIPVASGRPQAPARLIKDNIGRVWLRGPTQDGALHYLLWAGFAEVYLATLDGTMPRPQPFSPRQALSNFYPMWSRDGRYIAYTSERGGIGGRELWVYSMESGRESRIRVAFPLGRPYGWSPDSRWILASGNNDGSLYAIERETGRAVFVAGGLQRAPAWGPAGIVYDAGPRMVVYDPAIRRTVRTFDFGSPASVPRPPSLDGRSLLARHEDSRLTMYDTSTGRSRTWDDPGAVAVREHVMATQTAGVAYVVRRKDLHGDAWSLMFWSGSGQPHELLRANEPDEHFRLAGWTRDELGLLVIRWSFDAAKARRVGNETLWRIPITGGAPESTGLALGGLRDVSFHPDGRHLVFNAGYQQIEQWVMENVLPR
jgi:Tol biopolymer transport system component